MNQPETAAELSQATKRARKWFEHNRYHYDYDVEIPGRGRRNMQEVFDELIGLVETSFHLDLLSEAFEHRNIRNNRTNAEGRAPASPSPHHAPSPSTQPTVNLTS